MNIRYEMQHFTTLQIIVYKSFKTLRTISRGQCNRGGVGGWGGGWMFFTNSVNKSIVLDVF